MRLSAFKAALERHPAKSLAFLLPDGDAIPHHAHVTEMGRSRKEFLDCGGKLRNIDFAYIQVWVANDLDHRLPAGKLAAIADKAGVLFGAEDPEMQIECQQGSIALFSVEDFEEQEDMIVFKLANRHTACLAMEQCVPEPEEEACCGGASGCCA